MGTIHRGHPVPWPPGVGLGLVLVLVTVAALAWSEGCRGSSPLFRQAATAEAAGELIRAESLYRLSMAREPSVRREAAARAARLVAIRARMDWQEDEEDMARGAVREALELDPGCVPAKVLTIEMDLQDDAITLPEARVALDALVAQHPGEPIARYAYGRILLELGEAGLAMEQFHAAMGLEPGELEYEVAYYEAMDRVNHQEADARMERLVANHPRNVTVRLGYARLLAQRGEFDRAEALLDETMTLAPKDARISWVRKRIERMRREWDVGLDHGAGP